MYSMWFSHPAMDGIVYWNLADGYTYNAVPGDMSAGENYYRGGLLRFDGSEFHNFSTKGAIATPSIRCLFEDSAGRL